MTLMDRLDYISRKYIRKTAKDIPKTSEDDLILPTKYEGKPNQLLTPEKCREYALISSLFIKGTIKKNSDTFRAWFKLKRDDGIKMPQDEIDTIRYFEKRTQIKQKFKIAGISADIWGDGYLLIKFNEKLDKREKASTRLKRKVPEDAEPLDVILLNPENIKEMYYPDDEGHNLITNGINKQIYYHYINIKKNENFPIHPDRILHVKTFELPNSPFGISKVQILRNILAASEDIDVATGEILKWFSHGIQVLTKAGMQKAERTKALELLAKHPNYFAFSEKYKLEVINPTAINPTPFYEHVVQAVADALIMPKHVLQGLVVGRVTGAEVGWADYYRDIRDNQDLVYTPLIEKLYGYLGKSNNKDFSKYEVVWETTYIDELAEAEILGKRVAAAANAKSAGLISIKEARRIINEGNIELDPEKIPKQETKSEIPVPSNGEPPKKNEIPEKPNERIVKPVKREEDNYKEKMIDSLKDIIKRERKLGEEILKEQEEQKDES